MKKKEKTFKISMSKQWLYEDYWKEKKTYSRRTQNTHSMEKRDCWIKKKFFNASETSEDKLIKEKNLYLRLLWDWKFSISFVHFFLPKMKEKLWFQVSPQNYTATRISIYGRMCKC